MIQFKYIKNLLYRYFTSKLRLFEAPQAWSHPTKTFLYIHRDMINFCATMIQCDFGTFFINLLWVAFWISDFFCRFDKPLSLGSNFLVAKNIDAIIWVNYVTKSPRSEYSYICKLVVIYTTDAGSFILILTYWTSIWTINYELVVLWMLEAHET